MSKQFRLSNLVFLSVILFLFCLLLVSSLYYQQNRNSDFSILNPSKSLFHSIPLDGLFYNDDLFWHAVFAAKSSSEIGSKAIVVPHHLLAADIIAELFVSAKGKDISNIVIIGPNHENKGVSAVSSGYLKWETPFGGVETDNVLVGSFLDKFKIQSSVFAFEKEHSIGAIVPFVSYYFPNTKVVPIIFNSTATFSDVDSVSKWMKDNLDDNSLVVISTDFSHYLHEDKARNNDKITKQLILDGDIDKIMLLNNDFVDSPASLSVGILYSKLIGLSPNIIRNNISNDFLSAPSFETTSYFGISFTPQK